MDREWRPSAEYRLEGSYIKDRTTFGAFEDAVIIVWSLVVLAVLIVFVLPYRIVRFLFAPERRITTQPRHRAEPQEGKDEYNRDIWRYGR